MQGWDLDKKISWSKNKIRGIYNLYDGKISVSFSGGKDSTVLLNLVREEFPDVEGVFSNTGLEYPEIVEFVKTFDNVKIVTPEMSFKEVIDTYGYPAVSKQVARYVRDLQNPTDKNEKTRKLRMGLVPNRSKMSELSKKWRFLVDSGFKFSEQCCDVMKKKPLKHYAKESGKKVLIGTMAEDSAQRKMAYMKTGCFNHETGIGQPLAFWNEKDIWAYIKLKNIKYCSIYDTGVKRTGCIYCMFGVHLEKRPNRFDLLKKSHPVLYNYCMNTLGIKKILDLILKKGDK